MRCPQTQQDQGVVWGTLAALLVIFGLACLIFLEVSNNTGAAGGLLNQTQNETQPCESNQCTLASFDGDTCIRRYRDYQMCDDRDVCTKDDVCFQGKCRGKPYCSSGDACDVVSCRPGDHHWGNQICFVAERLLSCKPGCTRDGECGLGYVCISGVCKQHANTDDLLHVEGMTMGGCGGGEWRLIMDLNYVSMAYTMGTSLRSRRISSSKTIIAQWPFDWIHSIRNLRHYSGNGTYHSVFTIWGQCQALTPENCDTVFASRKYRFALDVKDCAHETLNCEREYPGQSFEVLSTYINCPFALHAEAPPAGSLSIQLNWPRAEVEASGWEPTYWEVTLCVVDPLHRFAPCARNAPNITCPRRGCDWDADDPTIRPDGRSTRVEIFKDGEITPQGTLLGVQVQGTSLSFNLYTFEGLDEIVVDALLLFGGVEEKHIQSIST